MKLPTLLFVHAIAMMPVSIFAGPMQTCEDQKGCTRFTIDKVNEQQCSDEKCEYKICMKLVYGGTCSKSGLVTHTCEKPDDVCLDGGGFLDALKVTGISDGYQSCHTVPPGGIAEFLIRDGDAASLPGGCGTATKTFNAGFEATCGTQPERSCTTNANIGKECVWTIAAPPTCGNQGGGGGDPHIKKWDGQRFAFHGECDLLLLHSTEFGDNTGLDIQIRTTIKEFYSFIEAAALRIGNSTLEVTMGHVWINGLEISDEVLPMGFAGYTLNAPYKHGNAQIYEVLLNDGDSIKFSVYKFFISVDVSGQSDDFGNSIGLLGDFYTGQMVGRDDETIVESEEEYGLQWQVRGDEPLLFRQARAPQLPMATCRMPSTKGRKLAALDDIEVKAAERACMDKKPEDFSFCVSDVLMTGDLGMAGAW